MSEAAGLPDRVTRLEHQLAEVRFLATKAEKEASDCVAVLHGHTGVLNAIREDQVEQGKKLATMDARLGGVETRLGGVETEMRTGFARVDAEARRNFALLAQGQERITELLTRHIADCESEHP